MSYNEVERLPVRELKRLTGVKRRMLEQMLAVLERFRFNLVAGVHNFELGLIA